MQTKTSRIGGAVLGMLILAAPAVFAQTPFVEGGFMAERDATESFYGSPAGGGGRAGFGLLLTDRSTLRFEVDVPQWRTFGPLAVRTISYGIMYAHRLPDVGRV